MNDQEFSSLAVTDTSPISSVITIGDHRRAGDFHRQWRQLLVTNI